MRFCENCGEPIDKNAKVCSKCGKKHNKEKNMLLYFISMIIIFIIFDYGASKIYSNVYYVIRDSKYGVDIVVETIWAFVCFAMMLFCGNKYIFDRKKTNFFQSIKLAAPPMVIAIISFIANFTGAYSYSTIDVLGVALYALTIGITEEFMCRGWLLTEFLERYGYDLKHVRLSIICTALIFGGMHLTNIFAGQTVYDTVLQVIQTFGVGYLLGAVFFRTRNIWSVVFVHAFYDFSLMLGEIGPYSACQTGEMTTPMMITSVVVSILLCAIYILVAEMNLRKEVAAGLLPRKMNLDAIDIIESKKLYGYLLAGVFILIGAIAFIPDYTYDGYETCVKYDTKEISNYYMTTYNSDSYTLSYDGIEFKLYTKDSNLYVYSIDGDKEFKLMDDISKFIVIKNNDYFVISIYVSSENKIVYRQIYYTELREEDSFLEKILDGNKEFTVPSLSSFDTISFDEYGERYVAFTSDDISLGMIDSDYELYQLEIK